MFDNVRAIYIAPTKTQHDEVSCQRIIMDHKRFLPK